MVQTGAPLCYGGVDSVEEVVGIVHLEVIGSGMSDRNEGGRSEERFESLEMHVEGV